MTDPASFEEFRAAARKAAKEDWLVRRVRVFTIRLSWVLSRTGISADKVTITGICCGLTGALLLASADVRLHVTAAILILAWILSDFIDGDLARWQHARGRPATVAGDFLDYLGNVSCPAAIYALAGLGVASASHESLFGLLGVIAAGGALNLPLIVRNRTLLIALYAGQPHRLTTAAARDDGPIDVSSLAPTRARRLVKTVVAVHRTVVHSLTLWFPVVAVVVCVLLSDMSGSMLPAASALGFVAYLGTMTTLQSFVWRYNELRRVKK